MNVTLTKRALKSLDQRVREHEGCAEDEWVRDLLAVTKSFWMVVGIGFIALLVILGFVFKAVA